MQLANSPMVTHSVNRRCAAVLDCLVFGARYRRRTGARDYYDQQRARSVGHHAALPQLGNRLVGILHGCLKTGTLYDETPPGPIIKKT